MAKSKKGSGFERTICKELSLWWSAGRNDDVFYRTAGSGARATTRLKKGKKTHQSYGDVGALRKSGELLTRECLIELKRGYTGKKNSSTLKSISIIDIIDTPSGFKNPPVLLKWWMELNESCIKSDRWMPMLIFRRDRKVACIVISVEFFNILGKELGRPAASTCFLYTGAWQMAVIPLNDFFRWVRPSQFKKVLRCGVNLGC